MDSDELMTSPLLAAPPNSPAQMELSTPVSSIIHFNSSVDLSHTLQQTQFSHPTFHTSTPHDIHPPTPQSPADSQEPQDINMHSPRIPPTPTSARRQRFTMGPRADCEKCRMRVKDHWMHFDWWVRLIEDPNHPLVKYSLKASWYPQDAYYLRTLASLILIHTHSHIHTQASRYLSSAFHLAFIASFFLLLHVCTLSNRLFFL